MGVKTGLSYEKRNVVVFKNEFRNKWELNVEIKGQLDATEWLLLQNVLSVQHVSGTIMSIIRNSRFIQMVATCGTWRFGLHVIGLVWSSRLCFRVAGCCSNNNPQPGHTNLQLHTRPMTCKPKRNVPQAATICITVELLMMDIMVPETCWTDNKFCSKSHSVASSWPFISRY